MKRIMLSLMLVLFAASVAQAETRVLCASTTSTQNSGFFDYLIPIVKAKLGLDIQVIAVGTGAALETGKRGDVDFVIVHARELELKAVEEGYFVDRHDLMYNDFVFVGPKADPAGLKSSASAVDALKKIASAKAGFISRGDKSGTHIKELALWEQAGGDPSGQPWYLEVGQGMEKTLRIAGEKGAYTLTDRATWLAVKDKDNLELALVYEGDPVLFNQYGVMAVNPARFGQVRYQEAMKFITWIISREGQEVIAVFKDAKGNQLFYPNAK